MTDLETALSWRGHLMYDQDGDKIGRIEEIYLDQQTDRPEWALVHTGLFGSKSTFVPIENADPSDDGVRVPFEKERVKDAPGIDSEGELSEAQEAELYAHYGMGPTEGEAGPSRMRRHEAAETVTTTAEGDATPGERAEANAERRTS